MSFEKFLVDGGGCFKDYCVKAKGRHQKKKTADLVKTALLGGGVRKIIEFSPFTNEEKHGRGGVSE